MSVFFVSRKTGFKSWLNTSLIPFRYLAVCQASSAFSYCNPDSFLIPGGLIELLFLVLLGCFSTPPRYLSCRRPFSRHLSQQISRYLSIPASVEIYCQHYISPLCDPELISLSLSRYFSVFSPKTLSSHFKLCSSRILQAFSRISFLGKLLILSYSCISCFET